ncbi:MAG: 3-phosphoshikimate 1-carboxyvinyltransferase [Candidatus Algichlamydia australiensis]|nr:3-phosphoshikimate 1-carboxyvinyltransferase [Chlamydiales bacterium]
MRIRKSYLSGKIKIPPSKSHTHRALLFASLASGPCTIKNALESPDIETMRRALCELKKDHPLIDSGNSGIVYRFLAGLAATTSKRVRITGDQSIKERRPIQPLLNAVNSLGGTALPGVEISGPLRPGKVKICGKDSQPVSALLIACAISKGPFEIEVVDAQEREWLDVTLGWFDFLEIPYEREGYKRFFLPGSTTIKPFNYTVPADFSSAAFPIAASIVTKSQISIEGLDFSDSQGDKKLFDYVKMNQEFSGGEIDVGPFVDALPILATLACYAKKPTRLFNGAICRQKESDRIHAIAQELRKMGAIIEEKSDGLLIQPAKLKGANLKSHHDHRIAMALAVAAMGASGETTIEGFTVHQKTYPTFCEDFKKLGANLE